MKKKFLLFIVLIILIFTNSCENVNLIAAAYTGIDITDDTSEFRVTTLGKVNWKANSAIQLYSFYTPPAGTETEVTAATAWTTDDDTIAEFLAISPAGLLTLKKGGYIVLTAEYSGKTISTSITILGP